MTAGTLSIGTGEAFSSLDDVTSTIKLGDSTSLGELDPAQNTGSTINLNGGGKLLVDDGSGQVTGATVKGKTLNINGGAIVFGEAASNASDLTVRFADGQMTDGYIGVSSGDTVTLELNGMTVESKIQAASFVASEGTINVAGTLELTSNANATAGAVYDFTSSGLNLISRNGNDNDSASALAGSGSIVVSGGAAGAKATLLISKDNLNDFLTDNATGTADTQDNAGAVVVSGNGVLELDGTETYDLADTDDFKWTGSAAAGKIYVNSGTVKAENILLSKALSGNTATAFNIEAANLTVGSDSQDVDDGDFKFNTATVTNSLTLDAYTGVSSVKLADTYNFTRPLDEGQKNPGESATRGSIGGDDMVLVATGSVNVLQGDWEASNNITLSGGAIKVGDASATDMAYLKLNELTFTTSTTKAIEVGGNTSHASVLDLTGATITDNIASGMAGAYISTNGTLIMDKAAVEKLIDVGTDTSGAVLYVNGGTLQVNGGLEADFLDFDASDLALDYGKINISSGNGGKIVIDGTADLSTGSSAALSLGIGSLTADTLKINNTEKVGGSGENKDDIKPDVTIADGTYNVLSSLTTDNKNILIGDAGNDSGATVNLYTETADGEGTVHGNLVVDGGTAESALKVALGSWDSDGTLTVTNGTVTIGQDSTLTGVTLGEDEEVSFTATKLVMDGTANGDASVTVSEGASATFTGADIDATGNTVTVQGTLTFKGNGTGVGSGDTAGSVNAIDYETGTLVLDGGDIVFEAAAVDNGLVTRASADADVSVNGAFGKIDNSSTSGGTVTLDFTSGNFDLDDLTELKKALFSDVTDNKTVKIGDETVTYTSLNNRTVLNIGNATIAGVSDKITNNTVAWNDVKMYADVISDVTTAQLQGVGVTGYTVADNTSDPYQGHYGYIVTDKDYTAATPIKVTGDYSTLNNAGRNDGKFASTPGGTLVGFNVDADTKLGLVNGGQAGDITLGSNSVLETSGTGETLIASVDGDSAATSDFSVGHTTTVTGDVKDVTLNITKAAFKSGENGNVIAAVNMKGGSFETNTFTTAGNVELDAGAVFTAEDFIVNNIAHDVDIAEGSTLTVTGNFRGFDGATIHVGEDAEEEAERASTPGYLEVKTMFLNGATLLVDPDFTTSASYASIEQFEGADTKVEGDGGFVDGTLVAGMNAVIGVGTASVAELQQAVKGYTAANGALDAERYGSILYVASNLEEKATEDMKIVLDPEATRSTYVAADYTSDITLGNHSAIIVNSSAFGKDGTASAIKFQNAATIDALGGEVILRGSYNTRDTYNVFEDNSKGLSLADPEQTVTFKTENGLLYVTQDSTAADGIGYGIKLVVDTESARSILRGASEPVFGALMNYASRVTDWTAPDAEQDPLLSGKVLSAEAYTEQLAAGTIAASDWEAETADGVTTYHEVAHNSFLDTVVSTGNGQDAESVARLAVYGGAAEVALAASSVTSDAIASRMGMGNPNGNLVMADNEKGAGLWLAPVYKNHESDDFDAEGVNYGVDLDLTGVALGADYTFGSNVRGGAMFAVGSGDADGQGAGSAVSNDFDFWSVGVYGGYAYEAFSLTADLSWTQVDNDIDANTAAAGKVSASMDADVLSAGLTAKYDFDLDMVKVAPHLGMRYTSIDIDDYTVSDIASSDVDSISVFSIPAGVMFSADIATASGWNVKPALDLTVTLNTGDDEVDSDVRFNGVDMTTDLTSEFIDDVTYGATVGVQVQKDAFQFGLGVNYTGSDNTDEFGVGANARFTF